MTASRRSATNPSAIASSPRAGRARSGRRGLSWLFCLVATLLLFATRPAAAMVLAPMCGGNGETLTAPPISRAAAEVPLAPMGCDRKADPRFENRDPKPVPAPITSAEVVPRLPPVRYRLPTAPGVKTPVESTTFGERPAHGRGIERPPR